MKQHFICIMYQANSCFKF